MEGLEDSKDKSQQSDRLVSDNEYGDEEMSNDDFVVSKTRKRNK